MLKIVPYPKLSESICSHVRLIRRWCVYVRLDGRTFWDAEAVTRHEIDLCCIFDCYI